MKANEVRQENYVLVDGVETKLLGIDLSDFSMARSRQFILMKAELEIKNGKAELPSGCKKLLRMTIPEIGMGFGRGTYQVIKNKIQMHPSFCWDFPIKVTIEYEPRMTLAEFLKLQLDNNAQTLN